MPQGGGGRPQPKPPVAPQRSINAAQSVAAKPAAKPRKRTVKKAAAAPAVAPAAGLPVPATTPVLSIDDQTRKWVKENYGDYMSHFLEDPTIGHVILDAARQGWDVNKLYGALQKTDWWQKTSDSARKWEQHKAEDPASATQEVQEIYANLSDKARTMGLQIDNKRLMTMSEDIKRFGWDETQIIDGLVKEVSAGGIGPGSIDVTKHQIIGIAKKYMLPLSDGVAMDWAMRIAKGEMEIATVQVLLGEQAKARFPGLSDIIDKGGTPADFFAPYQETAARLLEVPSDSIDFTKAPYSQVLQAPEDPTQVMRLSDFERLIKQDQRFGWKYTDNANDAIDSLTMFIGDKFGATTA
jgi:hypothetical protein